MLLMGKTKQEQSKTHSYNKSVTTANVEYLCNGEKWFISVPSSHVSRLTPSVAMNVSRKQASAIEQLFHV